MGIGNAAAGWWGFDTLLCCKNRWVLQLQKSETNSTWAVLIAMEYFSRRMKVKVNHIVRQTWIWGKSIGLTS